MNELTDRELASLAWIGLVAVAGVFYRPLRAGVVGILRLLLAPAFLIPVVFLGFYTAALVGLASLTPAWNVDLLKDTLLWFFTVGLVLMFRAVNGAKEDGWFLSQLVDAVRLTVLLEFYLNLHTLPFWGEFLLQGWLLILILGDAGVQYDRIRGSQSLAGWGCVFVWLQTITVLALLAYVGIWLFGNWASLDLAQQVRALLLPAWLTAFSLPFMYVWAVYLNWDTAVRQVRGVAPDRTRIGIRTGLAVLVGYAPAVRRPFMRNAWGRQLAEAPNVRAKLRVVGEHRARLRRDADEKRRKAENLVRHAGYIGTDAEGRRMDRREFAETIKVLENLSTAQMGWYRNEPAGSYKDWPDAVISALTRGLPQEHGVTVEVSADGQSWYAWRRTVSGWVFAVGAAGPPPDQRFYDGEDPPTGFPGPSGDWGHEPFERGPNWDR